ncbi:hypothetical protein Ddye_000108 [Dipteronia dyeriana]|uniref:FAR1 domain-containing protein n=1 Tax=Dipteronia dyeriana TaxID=168575 RepID=A0AAD9XL48_9ROSI|nr:hypothetical protein Ddye_000108 [Dipteronia dyeriana]
MCSTGVNYMQFSSWEGIDNQDVDLNHIKNMKFDFVEDTMSFYLGYARGNGLGIRATNLDYDSKGRVLKRKWVYDKQRSRREEYMTNKNRKTKPRLQTIQNCEAFFSVGLDSDTLKYNVRVFMDDHSHKIVMFREVSSHQSHKSVDEGDYAQIDAMTKTSYEQVVEDCDWDSSKRNMPVLSCECELLQNKEIPCCHMFYVMKVENITKIPESLIFKRWMKSAADYVRIQLQPDEDCLKSVVIARFTSLSA